MLDMNEPIKEWRTLEYPFMHEGITHAEFVEEWDYYAGHHKEWLHNEGYVPLWKQRCSYTPKDVNESTRYD